MTEKITIQMDPEALACAVARRIVDRSADWGYDSETGATEFEGDLATRVTERINEKIDGELERVVQELAKGELRDLVRGRIEPIVTELFEKGIPQTNQWGERTGTLVTPGPDMLKAALDDLLKGNRNRRDDWLSKLVREVWTSQIKATMDVEMEHLQWKIRDYVDKRLAGEVVQSLRNALGLK